MTIDNLNQPATSHRVAVGFGDDLGLDLSTITTGCIRVYNSTGFDVFPTFVTGSITPLTGNPSSPTYATAEFDIPGPFTAADNGCYFIEPVAGCFEDTSSNTNLAQEKMCDFQVLIQDPTLVDKTPTMTSNTTTTNTIPTGFTAFASSDFSTRPAWSAFDNNTVVDVNLPLHGLWTSDNEVAGATLGMLLECEIEGSQLQVSAATTTQQGFNPDRYLRTFDIDITTDGGGSWTSVGSFSSLTPWSAGDVRTFDFPPTLFNGWRIVVATNHGNASFVDVVQARMFGGYTI